MLHPPRVVSGLQDLAMVREAFGDRQVESISTDDILSFLTGLSESAKPATKRHRYSALKAFFNFLKNSIDPNLPNPCDTAMLRKMFRERPPQQWKIVEKDLADEIIFRTMKPRNRIMLELMARGGMRVGEVLKIRPMEPCAGLKTYMVENELRNRAQALPQFAALVGFGRKG